MSELSLWQRGASLGGELVVERELGRGGMGAIYLVTNELTGAKFAAKRTLVQSADQRLEFLRELEAWIDLPEHPNLVSFRFFRALQGEVAIFAEYVDGKTLHDWIIDTKAPALASVLDIALQFARGLAIAHEAGLVHHDVKPSNVLLTTSGIAKVTDFGLARARAREGERMGMTEQFCSPEQAAGKATTRATDIWSWGLSILNMFSGEVTWSHGSAAPLVLEDYLTSGEARRTPMPPAIAELLRKCFAENPSDRWPSFEPITAILEEELRRLGATVRGAEKGTPKRALDASRAWADPTPILDWSRRASGQRQHPASRFTSGSPRVAAIADLAAYEEARELLLACDAGRTPQGREALASILLELGFLYDALGDVTGAGASAAEAARLCEELHAFAPDAAHSLATRAKMVMGESMRKLGRHGPASRALDEATSLLGEIDAPEDAGWLALYRARVARDRGDDYFAATFASECASAWTEVVRNDPRAELVACWLEALLLAASKFRAMRDHARGAALLHGALAALATEPLDTLPDCAVHVGRVQLELARIAAEDPSAADGDAARAAALAAWNSTRTHPAWNEDAGDLAQVLLTAFTTTTDGNDVEKLLQQAMSSQEQLVIVEGRSDLAHGWAEALLVAGNVQFAAGNDAGGMTLNDRALELWRRLVHHRGRKDLSTWLLSASMNRYAALVRLGQREEAWFELTRATAEAKQLANSGTGEVVLHLHDELRMRRFWSGLALSPSAKRRLVERFERSKSEHAET